MNNPEGFAPSPSPAGSKLEEAETRAILVACRAELVAAWNGPRKRLDSHPASALIKRIDLALAKLA
jgi:hypothetical protein